MMGFGWADLLKSIAIVITAAAGLYVALFELRSGKGLTLHGRIVALILILGALVALTIQVHDTRDANRAAKVLEVQVIRQQATLREVQAANSLLTSTLASIQTVRAQQAAVNRAINASVTEQRRATTELNQAVVTAAAKTRASITAIDAEVSAGQRLIRHGVARLSRPLKDVTFRYRLVFHDADKTFPALYSKIDQLAQRADEAQKLGLTVNVQNDSVQLFDTSPFFASPPDKDEVQILTTDHSQVIWWDLTDAPVIRAFSSYSIQLAGSAQHVRDWRNSSITLIVNRRQRTIEKHVTARPDSIQLQGAVGGFTSELDLLDPDHPEHIEVLYTPFSRDRQRQPSLERFEIVMGPYDESMVFSEKFAVSRVSDDGNSYSFKISEAVKTAVYY